MYESIRRKQAREYERVGRKWGEEDTALIGMVPFTYCEQTLCGQGKAWVRSVNLSQASSLSEEETLATVTALR